MKRTTLLSVASALIAMGVMSVAGYGCGDDDDGTTSTPDSGNNNPDTATPDSGTPDSSKSNPPVPTLGAQIDRMGRPAINTALNHVFDTDAGAQGAAKDAYNQDTAQAGWSAKYVGETSANLAVFDSLDTICGNQLLVDADAGANGGSAVQTYGTLGGVVSDDRLWLDTAGATCNTYLAVEANATKILPNTDCGGRAPKYDVIDTTYSVVAIGKPVGVSDGINADATKTAATAFPYLVAPTP